MDNNELNVKECLGCAFCCYKAPCVASVRLYPSAKVCPALLWSEDENRYVCDLMTIPELVGESYRKELYAGEGCCMNLNTWRKDVKNRDEEIHEKEQEKIFALDKLFQIFLNCLGKQWIDGDIIFLTLNCFKILLIEKFDYNKDEAIKISKLIEDSLKNNKPKFLDEFMG